MNNKRETITIEDTRLLFSNFSGAEGRYNAAGKRNTNVVLPIDVAKQMEADGWNIGWLQPREEEAEAGVEPTPYTQVTLNYATGNPPKVVTVTSTARTVLNEDTVGMLDFADIENVDVVINPFHWNVNGKSGIKGYVKTMYVTISEDDLDRKYALPGDDDV